MPAVTLSEAAQALGFKSRSTLYRLRDAGDLADYLRPPSSPGGAQLLELTPAGRPPLAEHVNRLIRPQANNHERYRQPRIDQRWGMVAGLLSEALAGCGGLSLCDAEAEALAAALPTAMGEAFGAQGLESLRVALADAGCWRAGPRSPLRPGSDREWWGDDGWGRWEPGEPLETDAFWQHVGGIVGGMMGGRFEPLSGGEAVELHLQLQDAIGDVEAGARWDADRWDAASARSLIDDWVDDPSEFSQLRALVDGGRLPPDLLALALELLAPEPAPEPLPVVLTD